MFFNDEPKNYEPIDPEELNNMIDAWGRELFKEEAQRQRNSAFFSESGLPTPMPKQTKDKFAFVRTWKNLNRRDSIAEAA
jgi:hypothetical protein